MRPKDMAYEIARCYIADQADVVNPALVEKIRGFLRSRNLAGLATCSSHFDRALHSIEEFRFLRQVEAFFKKNADFAQPLECAAEAKRSFFECEANCSATNIRLRQYVGNNQALPDEFRLHILRMQRYIRNVLGEIEPFLDSLHDLVRVTPGATASRKREESLPPLKMRLKLYATRRAHKYLKAIYAHYGFENLRVKTTVTNRVEFVPKNWKTDRTIACEPEGNLPLQLAFDKYAKRQLKVVGIDLSNQSVNQQLAFRASIDGRNATVDFKNASDTISYNAVALVFPEEWFAFLADVRSPGYRLGAKGSQKYVYSKFSSMGNGTTFVIETLLFAAACWAVSQKRDFSVYGDDVILPVENFESFQALTRFLGFTINSQKSYCEGPFRESCGGDFYGGVNVTPVYVRKIGKQNVYLCHLVNTVRELCIPGGELAGLMSNIIQEFKLPVVPWNESTLSGIWITTRQAFAKKLIQERKRHRGVRKFKAYVPKSEDVEFPDSRGYYLWFLSKKTQVFFAGPWESARAFRPTITSKVPVFTHEYVRKWVCWREPVTDMPGYLYWWPEQR